MYICNIPFVSSETSSRVSAIWKNKAIKAHYWYTSYVLKYKIIYVAKKLDIAMLFTSKNFWQKYNLSARQIWYNNIWPCTPYLYSTHYKCWKMVRLHTYIVSSNWLLWLEISYLLNLNKHITPTITMVTEIIIAMAIMRITIISANRITISWWNGHWLFVKITCPTCTTSDLAHGLIPLAPFTICHNMFVFPANCLSV